MRDLLHAYLDGRLSRRRFLSRLVGTGLTAAAARSLLEAADAGPADGSPPATGRSLVTGTGGELLVEQVRMAGTRFVFANPGSLEAGFFDALTDRPELQLIVGLHEGIVVSMADGYHKASRQPAFVNVHAAVGTAQMGGQLYNAHHDGSALVVTAGLNDATIYSDDMALAPARGFNQADINRQFTKISWEVRNGASLALAMRRAYKVAATAPGGPVYVAVSREALAAPASGDVWTKDAFLIEATPRPAADQVQALARLLVEAKRPVVILGDEVWKADAAPRAVALCETLGTAIGTVGMAAFQYLSAVHPQYVGRYTPDRPYPFGNADLVVQLGARDLGGGLIPEQPAVDPDATFVAVGLDTAMIGRTQPFDLAVVGDVKQAVADVTDAVNTLATRAQVAKIRQARLGLVTPATAAAAAERLARAKQVFAQTPIHPDRLGNELEQGLDRRAILVTENLPGLMGKNDFLGFGARDEEKLGIATGGSSLGWGVGAAFGVKLGAPERQVVLSIGDGSVMYSAAGFWSMARYQVPVLTVVWNNRSYQTVRNAYHRYNRRMAATGRYHGAYLGDPAIDFVKLAESQGMRGERVTNPSDIAAALRRGAAAVAGGSPYLIEFIVACVGGGAESTWHQEFRLGQRRAEVETTFRGVPRPA